MPRLPQCSVGRDWRGGGATGERSDATSLLCAWASGKQRLEGCRDSDGPAHGWLQPRRTHCRRGCRQGGRDLTTYGASPCLATVPVGDDPASATYVRMKRVRCAKAGIKSRHIGLPPPPQPPTRSAPSRTCPAIRKCTASCSSTPAARTSTSERPLRPSRRRRMPTGSRCIPSCSRTPWKRPRTSSACGIDDASSARHDASPGDVPEGGGHPGSGPIVPASCPARMPRDGATPHP